MPWNRKSFVASIKKCCTTCAYCGKKYKKGRIATIDHVIPKSRGGDTKLCNLVLCCSQCNNNKSNKTISEFWNVKRQKSMANYLTNTKKIVIDGIKYVEEIAWIINCYPEIVKIYPDLAKFKVGVKK